ncbi:WD40-repeat-containing domain protein [Chytriomyces sp. MP71]|nr:WD40-repeat-containing domain protein [Chytriomyces sp. MP71]
MAHALDDDEHQRIHLFSAAHEDVVHDVQYDYYGRRIATSSSDQRIKVWQLGDDDGGEYWTPADTWKAHDGSIAKVAWAHPEFGSVLASSSFDRTVKIWEENENEPFNCGRRWKLRATFTDSKGSVQGLEFAPHHLGLKLATCSADGWVRIYEAPDIMNLSNWSITGEFEAVPGSKETDRLCISWCPSRMLPQQIVVGCGDQNVARIYRVAPNNQWLPVEFLGPHLDVITDVAWAPNMGRSYQLIATASKDAHVRLFKLTWEDQSQPDSQPQSGNSAMASGKQPAGKWRVDRIGAFKDHGSEVWRVDWNILGTILSSSGDDGTVRLWKSSHLDAWMCSEIINGE